MENPQNREQQINELMRNFESAIGNGDFMGAVSQFMGLLSSGSQFEIKIDQFNPNLIINENENDIPKYQSHQKLHSQLSNKNYDQQVREKSQKLKEMQQQKQQVQQQQQIQQQQQQNANPQKSYQNGQNNNQQPYQNPVSPLNNNQYQQQNYSPQNNLPQQYLPQENNNFQQQIPQKNPSSQQYQFNFSQHNGPQENRQSQLDVQQNFPNSNNIQQQIPVIVNKQLFNQDEVNQICSQLGATPRFADQFTLDQMFLNYITQQNKIL